MVEETARATAYYGIQEMADVVADGPVGEAAASNGAAAAAAGVVAAAKPDEGEVGAEDVGWEEADAASAAVSSAAAGAVAVAAAVAAADDAVAIRYSAVDIGSPPAANDGLGGLRLALKHCTRGTR